MKCPKCGSENVDDYKFCRKCGEPNPEAGKETSSNKASKKSFDDLLNKRNLFLGIAIIAIVAVIAIGLNNAGFGGVQSGNEKILNIDQNQYVSSGENVYSISFTLTNAPKEANSYFAKATWYDEDGTVVMTDTESLDYKYIDDNHMDIYMAEGTPKNVTIKNCVIEITDSQGEVVTTADYKWLNK
ncbi:MAG: zinc ribbon domain-containing protein [Methanobrevibacter sp.]|uniref:zinc ribbon domain-containing protein n=1 Tax=Methanobrevibacter sp. TaxID=66852 RepID=UPI0026DF8995|nr:zinc ribbon domain-containing protein [Methanobrevibacter sp.]MDO5849481.1 zinc ribbon domain-containing protein [Methanobrevibacter sp.]